MTYFSRDDDSVGEHKVSKSQAKHKYMFSNFLINHLFYLICQ